MTDADVFPEYWFFAYPNKELAGLASDAKVYYSAPRSMRFNAIGNDKPTSVSQFNFQPETKDFELSARVRVEGKVKFTIETIEFGRNRVPGERYVVAELDTTNEPVANDALEWKLLKGEVHLKSVQQRYRVQFKAVGEGTIWVDDVDAKAIAMPEVATAVTP